MTIIHLELSPLVGECLGWAAILLSILIGIAVVWFVVALWEIYRQGIEQPYRYTTECAKFAIFCWYRWHKKHPGAVKNFRKRAWELLCQMGNDRFQNKMNNKVKP